jgi:hypothetical protein
VQRLVSMQVTNYLHFDVRRPEAWCEVTGV